MLEGRRRVDGSDSKEAFCALITKSDYHNSSWLLFAHSGFLATSFLPTVT